MEGAVTDSLQTPDRGIRIATDLVNTHLRGVEELSDPAALRQFLLAHAEPEPVRVTAEELAEVRVIRQRLRAVFAAGQPAEAAAILNDLLATHATRPYLSDHDGNPWHLHVTTMDADWPTSLAAISAMALSVLVAGYGFEALRVCQAEGCEVAFASTTPRRVRRFCSQTCATRSRVTAHRARRRGQRGQRAGY